MDVIFIFSSLDTYDIGKAELQATPARISDLGLWVNMGFPDVQNTKCTCKLATSTYPVASQRMIWMRTVIGSDMQVYLFDPEYLT